DRDINGRQPGSRRCRQRWKTDHMRGSLLRSWCCTLAVSVAVCLCICRVGIRSRVSEDSVLVVDWSRRGFTECYTSPGCICFRRESIGERLPSKASVSTGYNKRDL